MAVSAETLARYQPVIGLEVHIQLDTNRKVFGTEAVGGAAAPNTQVSVITLGHPGALPYPNQACIQQMLRLGLATRCQIERESYFARKHYFYPDLPKGYQISQDQAPLCKNGYLDVPLADGNVKQVAINRIHLEEDAGKSIHDQSPTATFIDLNRAGTGLAELVTDPDLRHSAEAGAFFAEVRRLVRYLGVSDGNMEAGNLRCDANVSVMPKGSNTYGTRVEVKNLNSINFLMRAIDYEVSRQIERIESGESVQQQTRLWDTNTQRTYAMRDKETAQDYRYVPEPDMLPIRVDEETLSRLKKELPALPADRLKLYMAAGIGVNEAFTLIEEHEFARYFEALWKKLGDAKQAANWVLGPVRTYLNDHKQTIAEFPLPSASLAALVGLVDQKVVSFANGKGPLFLALITEPEASPLALADSMGLTMVSDTAGLEAYMDTLIEKHPKEVARYRKGQKKLLGFFIGQVMRQFKGSADPQAVNRVVKEKLEG